MVQAQHFLYCLPCIAQHAVYERASPLKRGYSPKIHSKYCTASSQGTGYDWLGLQDGARALDVTHEKQVTVTTLGDYLNGSMKELVIICLGVLKLHNGDKVGGVSWTVFQYLSRRMSGEVH